ncbi:uncharacterized protein LOC131160480 isoform X3 [Malania oleifera]|uniref:uncharacterized protein LOC131160480 isoform X3 n=1 Tax=Malania oleifera TaxID=397392 RepID=UPI0025AE2782|nr:uncharacterized protein LOC131160480 isoform X3 [Malania oleifera]XP_057972189.1 uncharacterized protein LOC131160480 isoform X3 [Malania oleifera]
MPLLKRKPFALLEPPEDLKPSELVYQVRFTKEIFRDYNEYLNRINLYRQRVWTCKVTGKINLTFEEALVSEKRATEKVQEFPKELMAPVLLTVQFKEEEEEEEDSKRRTSSPQVLGLLPLRDLVNTITARLQENLSEGVELYGKKDNCVYLCKIVKVLKSRDDQTQYEVAWLDKDKAISGPAIVKGEDLIRKKLPFSRNVLKSFIRESTRQSVPWVLHDKLARKHGISTDLPEELRSKFVFQDGRLVRDKKRRKVEDGNNILEVKKEEFGSCKRKKVENGKDAEKAEDDKPEESIKYPIDDLLVQPAAYDSILTDRPSPSRDFNVPMDCVGDLLMVWDFCSSFSRFLCLLPFSLEDFENAICHKDSNLVLVAESHASILRLLIKDDGEYFTAIQGNKRKSKITLINWTEYLCDFLEMIDIPELSTYIATIKRGHYGLLDTHAKLGILRELVAQAIATDLFREKLDENIEQRQALGATKRGEAIEEARKKREQKERLKAEPDTNGHSLESLENNLSENGDHKQNGDAVEKRKKNGIPSKQKHASGNSEGKHAKEAVDKKSKEQRREYFEREIEKRIVRTNPLGKDRHYNRYWFFRRDGRIFVESSDFKQWGYYSTKEELDALMGSLNCKGVRERALHNQLNKYYRTICSELQKRSKEVANKIAMEEAVLRRSTRVRAPPRDNPAVAFLRYVNKWKED